MTVAVPSPVPTVALHGRVLIAEADQTVADPIRVHLTHAGCDVQIAPEGQAALAAVAQEAPDLVLLGVALPDMSSSEVVRRLKSEDETRFLPIVLLTDGRGAQEHDLGAGADDFLAQPCSPAELLLRVKSLLRLGRMHQDLADNNRELQAAYETARESEAKYRALIQGAQDALFLITPSSQTIIETNRRARELSGYTDDDLTGQPAARLSCEEDALNWADLIERAVAEGGVSVEKGGTLRRKDGEVIPVEIQISLASHHLGEPLIQALMRDLRPRLQLEAERNKSERLAAVVETAVTVNHEINNPLFVITSNIEGLQNALFDADSSVRDRLERINESCRRIQRFTQQLSSVIAPVSKEYLPGMKMLDIRQSVAPGDATDSESAGK